MAAITIKDIAHELHFSVSTVSRALQNHPDISEETKKIITNYAREHHYRPNQMASSLRTQKVTTIGLILPELTSYFFSTILEGVEKAANVAGYNVLIARTIPSTKSNACRCLIMRALRALLRVPPSAHLIFALTKI